MAEPTLCKSGIYVIRNILSGRVYVGSAINLKLRWRLHRLWLGRGQHHSRRLQGSWSRHGEASFQFEVLEPVADRRLLLSREQVWIDHFQAFLPAHGYNMLAKAGSPLGHVKSAATRAKIGRSHKGRKHTDEARANMILGQRAREPLSQEIKDRIAVKISSMFKGCKLSAEHKAKIGAAHKGRPKSQEQIAKMKETMRANKAKRQERQMSLQF